MPVNEGASNRLVWSDCRCIGQPCSRIGPLRGWRHHGAAWMRHAVVDPLECLNEAPRQCAGDEQDVGLTRGVDQPNRRMEAEVLDLLARARCRDGEDGHRGSRSEPHQEPLQAHSSARSRHIYSTPSNRIVMNIAISTMATTPSRTKTTAHGYM